MQKNFLLWCNQRFLSSILTNLKIMESTHSQPLLQENSESDAEHLGDEDIHGQDDSIAENLDKELLRGGQSVPHDKYSFNYIIFYLMGMTTLLPWNFFITAEDVSHQSNITFTIQTITTIFFVFQIYTLQLSSVSHTAR